MVVNAQVATDLGLECACFARMELGIKRENNGNRFFDVLMGLNFINGRYKLDSYLHFNQSRFPLLYFMGEIGS